LDYKKSYGSESSKSGGDKGSDGFLTQKYPRMLGD